MAYQPNQGITSLVSTVPSSVQVGASVFGHAPVVIIGGSVATATTNSSVMLLRSPHNIGSVTTLQGTNPWVITGSVQGAGAGTQYSEDAAAPADPTGTAQVLRRTDTPSVSGSADGDWVVRNATNYGAAFTTLVDSTGEFQDTGSVAAFIQGTPNVNAAGSVVAFQGTDPWVVDATGQGDVPITLAGEAVVLGAGTAQVGNISGSVIAKNIIPSSLLTGASIIGLPPVNVTNTVTVDATGQGDVPITLAGEAVVLGAGTAQIGNVSGSVIARNIIPSSLLVGASVIGLTPVTGTVTVSNPQSSVKAWNAPISSWVQGAVDFTNNKGASVAVITAPGGSIRNYISGVQVANFGPASVLVTLAGGSNSIMGYTIAPAGGGSNIVYPNPPRTGAAKAFTASLNGVASVLISAQGFTN